MEDQCGNMSVDRREKQESVSVSSVHKLQYDCTSQMSKCFDIPANVVLALA
jgi:hypothetical protein